MPTSRHATRACCDIFPTSRPIGRVGQSHRRETNILVRGHVRVASLSPSQRAHLSARSAWWPRPEQPDGVHSQPCPLSSLANTDGSVFTAVASVLTRLASVRLSCAAPPSLLPFRPWRSCGTETVAVAPTAEFSAFPLNALPSTSTATASAASSYEERAWTPTAPLFLARALACACRFALSFRGLPSRPRRSTQALSS